MTRSAGTWSSAASPDVTSSPSILTWVFLAFIPIHVYLAIRADVLEHGGSISSIITGGRFVPRKHTYVDE